MEVMRGLPVIFMNSALLYLWYVYHFFNEPPILGRILVSVLLALTAWSYNRAALTDPGTPRCHEWATWAAVAAELGTPGPGTGPAERGWRAGQISWCEKCTRFRPERAHHCRKCGVCILRMDHHCRWIGNCVGWRNHKYFLLTVWWGFWACLVGLATARRLHTALSVIFVSCDARVLVRDFTLASFAQDMLAFFLACGLMLVCLALLSQDVCLAVRNTSRIETGYPGPSPYCLPSKSDNFRQLFGATDWRLMLPVPAAGMTSDGTCFPSIKVPHYGSIGKKNVV